MSKDLGSPRNIQFVGVIWPINVQPEGEGVGFNRLQGRLEQPGTFNRLRLGF